MALMTQSGSMGAQLLSEAESPLAHPNLTKQVYALYTPNRSTTFDGVRQKGTRAARIG